MKRLFLLFSLFLFVSPLIAQKKGDTFTVRGFIYDSEDQEAVGFIKVVLRPKVASETNAIRGATTDGDGFFQFSAVDAGTYNIEVRSIEHDDLIKEIIVGNQKILTLRYSLQRDEAIKEIDEVSVVGQDQSKKTRVDISVNKLDQESLERLPSFGAENDIVAAFSITPGVISTGDQGGQLYVRGGTPIQNKILLDGMTIYNPFHSIGFFSVFETELIKSADIYTGGFAAQYGGRISSIMDISYRDGNLNKHSGLVSASPFIAKAVLEGPLYRNKDFPGTGGSYVFTAKHSLLNYSSQTIYPYVNDGGGLPFSFTDVFGKLTFKTPEGSKFSVFGFTNNDGVFYENIADLKWNAYGGGLNFILVPSSNLVIMRGHLDGSYYNMLFQEADGQAPRTSSIGGFNVGFDFTYFLKNQSELTYGINIGGFSTNFHTFNEVKTKIELENFNTELSAYLNYRLVTGRWVINPGARLQYYPAYSSFIPEPRLGVKMNATENLRFKLSGGYYSQNFTAAESDRDIVTLFYGFLAAPTNVQSTFTKPNGKTNKPRNGIQTSWHGIFGVEYDLTKHFDINVEAYYKYFPKLSNINTNKMYDDINENSKVPDVFKKDFIIESGFSYGVDVLMKYQNKRLFVWGAYSYGKSQRWDGFEFYSPSFDRQHNVNIVLTYSFLKDKSLEISGRWNFGSGFPFTPTAGYYQGEPFSNGVTTDYTTSNPSELSLLLGDFNAARLPTYHRFDVTIKKVFALKRKMKIELKGGVTNIYDRDNIFYVNRVTNDKVYQLPVLPSLGLNFRF